MERKIGEKFTLRGKTYVVKEGDGCTNCAFNDTDLCNDERDARGSCIKSTRIDNKNVLFKELKEETIKLKHYYYYYQHRNGFGCGTGYSDDSFFPLSDATKKLREEYGRSATISFWREISQSEFEKMNDIIDEANNGK